MVTTISNPHALEGQQQKKERKHQPFRKSKIIVDFYVIIDQRDTINPTLFQTIPKNLLISLPMSDRNC